MKPVELLESWLVTRVPDPARTWLREAVARLRAGATERDLYLLVSQVARRVGKAPLALADNELRAATASRPGWDPRDWTADNAARVLLLLASTQDGAEISHRLDRLCAAADIDELVAFYRGLPLYPDPPRHALRAAEGVRSNMRVVFEAVAHRNPYPAEHFDEQAWNQMVLKALFVGSTLDPVAGLEVTAQSRPGPHALRLRARALGGAPRREPGAVALRRSVCGSARCSTISAACSRRALTRSSGRPSLRCTNPPTRRRRGCSRPPLPDAVRPETTMKFIDPHIHMSARTTDDYERMAAAGVVAVIEPAFWLGQPRTHVGTFIDYLSSLVGWERFRASQFGIRHYCTIGLNSKEANNAALAEQVMDVLPLFLGKEGVVAVGEIGYDDQTEAEDRYYRAQLQLAKDLDMLVQVHTPHRDKKRGTARSMDVALEMGLEPGRVVIDHNNEETVREVLDRGFWAAFTLYPQTKMGNERMVEIARQYGSHHIFIDSSADWGKSDPLAVPKTARLMLERGIPRADVEAICYGNALAAFGQSGQFSEEHWLTPQSRDQRQLFEGNSVLRGQEPGVGELPVIPERDERLLIE